MTQKACSRAVRAYNRVSNKQAVMIKKYNKAMRHLNKMQSKYLRSARKACKEQHPPRMKRYGSVGPLIDRRDF